MVKVPIAQKLWLTHPCLSHYHLLFFLTPFWAMCQAGNASCSGCLFCIWVLLWKDVRSRGPTCCATVCTNCESELLFGWGNLKAVIDCVGSLWAKAQVEPQLILSRSVGKLIYLLQTWGNSQTGSMKASSNTLILFRYAWKQTEHWIAHQSRTPLSCCQNLQCTVSSVSESPACRLYVAGAPEGWVRSFTDSSLVFGCHSNYEKFQKQ